MLDLKFFDFFFSLGETFIAKENNNQAQQQGFYGTFQQRRLEDRDCIPEKDFRSMYTIWEGFEYFYVILEYKLKLNTILSSISRRFFDSTHITVSEFGKFIQR